jgi:dipeptidyl aminopeptidase/acylaminoacyl peptidase
MHRALIAGVLSGLFALTMPQAASKRFIRDTDLLKFTWIADPQISPDGSSVAFVRVTVDEKENRYNTALFLVPASGGEAPRQLSAGIRDVAPRWSPDGRQLAFVRSVEKDGRPQPPQIYLLGMNGGEARPITQQPHGATDPVWSPDGKRLAFISETGPEDDLTASRREPGFDSERMTDVKVITRAEYRSNGKVDYVDEMRHSHIFVVDIAGGAGEPPTPKPLTDGDFDEQGAVWAPDGARIYFTSDRVAESYYAPGDTDLYSVPAAGGAITKVASIDGLIAGVSPSPDGKRLAFIGTLHGNPVRSYSQPDLWVIDARAGAAPTNLTLTYDSDIGGGIGGDQASPRGQQPKPIVWSRDGGSLIVVSAERGSANLTRVDIASRKARPLTRGDRSMMTYSATPNGSTIAAVASTQTNIGDIEIIPVTDGISEPRRITKVNEELFRDIEQSEPEEIWYSSFDGKRIQGWILKPPDFDPDRTYPLILEIHGGPHSAYGNVYTHEFMWMAAKGYVVLFANPRGSTTYGQEFGNIIQFKYPGDDYRDLMAGVDEVIRRGYVDSARLGITGGSGGGLLTNWTITQTQRFKAAVSQRDIADWYGFWFTADFSQFQPGWFRKAPWEDPNDFIERSPIAHVGNVTTPLMLILGDADYRTPPGNGGEVMFRALKYLKVPTVMVRFPRENHELSRSGEPRHRVERLRHIVGWMDRWLQINAQTDVGSGTGDVSRVR